MTADRILYIMRGLPGSGKSTLAKQLAGAASIFSTDDFFMRDNRYYFHPALLKEAHAWNQSRAGEAMASGQTPLVIDNTHVQNWEARPYVEAAMAHGYVVRIVEADTPWKFDPALLACRNRHGVPLPVLQAMCARWETDFSVANILAAEAPPALRNRAKGDFPTAATA